MKSKSLWRTFNLALALTLITYALVMGLLNVLPYQGPQMGQTSRNVFYHVPMWFGMIVLAYTSVGYSIGFLRKENIRSDIAANEASKIAVIFGILGLVTGSIWGRVTWAEGQDSLDPSAWWMWDPKQTSALICVLIYMGYFVLRMSFDEPVKRAKVAAVYNIFAAASIYPLFYVLPKVLGGLHPNTGGQKSALGSMSQEYYSVFWPAVIGFVCLGIWILDLRVRTRVMEVTADELEDE